MAQERKIAPYLPLKNKMYLQEQGITAIANMAFFSAIPAKYFCTATLQLIVWPP